MACLAWPAWTSYASALDVAAAIRAREVSPLEVLDDCLARVDARNPELNAVIWRNDEEARAQAVELGERIAGGSEPIPPFAGVPLPIKDLLPVAGQPVTYGSRGAPDGPSAVSEPVADASGGRRVRAVRTHQHARIRLDHRDRERSVRRDPQPVGHLAHPGWIERGSGIGGGGRDVPGGPRQRRWRLHPDPRLLLWPGRPQAQPGPGGRHRPRLAGHVHPGSAHPHRRRCRRHPRRDQRARPLRLVERTPARTALPGRGGCRPGHAYGWRCARCPLWASQWLPSRWPRRTCAARLLEAAGHQVSRLEADIFDPVALAPFLHVVNAGLGDMADIDWDRVEPHNQAGHAAGEAVDSLTLTRSLNQLHRMTRDIVARFDRDFDLFVTPTLTIEPP